MKVIMQVKSRLLPYKHAVTILVLKSVVYEGDLTLQIVILILIFSGFKPFLTQK